MADSTEVKTDPVGNPNQKSHDEKVGTPLYHPDAPDGSVETKGQYGGNQSNPGLGGGDMQAFRRPKIKITGRPLKGSRSPGIGYLYVLVLMFLAIIAGTALSGGFVPVDPNGPGGPPTLPPYYGADGSVDEQKLIMPKGGLTPDPRGNLQLKTFTVNVCSQKAAIDFLIDTSQSMKYEGKMEKLKSALRLFTSKLNNSAAVSMQTFSSITRERIQFNYYGAVKQDVLANINSLAPEGWTSTRTGMNMAKVVLSSAITKQKYPGYKYYLVLLTDGVPEIPQYPERPKRKCEATAPEPILPGGIRCFSEEQDPRVPTDVSADLKSLGVEIYVVALYGTTFNSDIILRPNLEALLKHVASEPLSDHYFSTLDATDINKIFESLVKRICDDPLSGNPQPFNDDSNGVDPLKGGAPQLGAPASNNAQPGDPNGNPANNQPNTQPGTNP